MKLIVLQACVTSTLLYTFQIFVSKIPKRFESMCYSFIKCCLALRSNTPNKFVLIESGLPKLESQIRCRQFSFYQRFMCNLEDQSARKQVIDELKESRCDYLDHYMALHHHTRRNKLFTIIKTLTLNKKYTT